jgi:phosphoserine aminotransferase
MSTERDGTWNFSAGPATLPSVVLEQARDELLSYGGSGMSVLEMSHRSGWFEDVIGEAEENLRMLLDIPEGFKVLFMQGGASLQFSMLAMNFLRGTGKVAEYVVSGSWAKKALAEGRREGETRVVWDGADDRYSTLPSLHELDLDPGAAYLHVTANETIQGVEFPSGFEVDGAPLVCDLSSDFLSRPVPVRSYGLLYAGAQKNAGPAGLTIGILGESMLQGLSDGLHTTLDYRTFVDNGSMYNTPPTFSIYMTMLLTRWLRQEIGGLDAMAKLNGQKADLLYRVIDGSGGFYRGHAAMDVRSAMNVTFRLPDEDLEEAFVSQAKAQGMLELKGHRSVGGCRASIYNSMPIEGVRTLAAFMESFAATHA